MEASKAKLKLSNIYKKPVILLEGINHSQFADGYGAKRDLKSPLSLEEAHKKIAAVTSAFILANSLSDDGAAMELAELQDRSSDKFSAFIKAQELEESLCDISQNILMEGFPLSHRD